MKNSTLGEAVQLDQQAIDSRERMSRNTATKNTRKSKELPTDQGPEGSHDSFVDVVQQLTARESTQREGGGTSQMGAARSTTEPRKKRGKSSLGRATSRSQERQGRGDKEKR